MISRVELIRKDKEEFHSARKIPPNGKPGEVSVLESERCLFWRVVPKREVSVLERCPY